ncbi:dehydrodolichyl diphosphate synthase complex subunit NUS1-like [Centruroides sculpturatus]|nr:dehydrodolichyl diphosphate synthase complex subunit NUS1-like [Centruroides sculpturatus]
MHDICRKVEVILLCRENGKSDIVDAVRRYSVEKESKLKFCNYLKGNADFPDPDLILQYGPCRSVMGYLPWHIRLTEMTFSRTHHQIDLSDFFNSLVRYNKCEQRFGK